MEDLSFLGKSCLVLGHLRFVVAVGAPALWTARCAMKDGDDEATARSRSAWLKYWCIASLVSCFEASLAGRGCYWLLTRSGGEGRVLFLSVARLCLAERLCTSRACDHFYAFLEAALSEREELIRYHLDRASAHCSARWPSTVATPSSPSTE